MILSSFWRTKWWAIWFPIGLTGRYDGFYHVLALADRSLLSFSISFKILRFSFFVAAKPVFSLLSESKEQYEEANIIMLMIARMMATYIHVFVLWLLFYGSKTSTFSLASRFFVQIHVKWLIIGFIGLQSRSTLRVLIRCETLYLLSSLRCVYMC